MRVAFSCVLGWELSPFVEQEELLLVPPWGLILKAPKIELKYFCLFLVHHEVVLTMLLHGKLALGLLR